MNDVMGQAEHREQSRSDAMPRIIRAGEPDTQTMLVRIEEGARLLDIGRSAVCQMLADGTLPAVRFGRSVRIRRSDLEALIERRIGGR